MVLAYVFEAVRNEDGELLFGARVNDFSNFSTIGFVIVILRKEANAFHAKFTTSCEVLFPVWRYWIERAKWDEAVTVVFDVANEAFVGRLWMAVKCGFDIRDRCFVYFRAVKACNKGVGSVVAQ